MSLTYQEYYDLPLHIADAIEYRAFQIEDHFYGMAIRENKLNSAILHMNENHPTQDELLAGLFLKVLGKSNH